jgi:hypothetical protein
VKIGRTVEELLYYYCIVLLFWLGIPTGDYFLRKTLPYIFWLLNVYLPEMRILSHQEIWSVASVLINARERSSWKSPLPSPKWGAFGSNSPMSWDESLRPPKGTFLVETASIDVQYVGVERSGSAVRLPNKTQEKQTLPVDNFTHMRRHDPTDRYELVLLGGPADVISSKICYFDQ